MIRNDEIMEAQLILVIVYLKQTHLTSDDVVSSILIFGDISDTAEIV